MSLTRVGHLDTRIRVPVAGSALAGRLDEVARERLPAALAASVARMLPEGSEVVVLRHVDVDLLLDAGGPAGPEEIAARWAGAAGAAAAAVAGRGDDRDVVRFADQASFVASFVADLLAGRAWERWCYGAFAALRDRPVGAAVAAALADHADELTDVLRTLDAGGTLAPALATLGPQEARAVWTAAASRGPQPLDAASAMPIAAAAVAVASRLRVPGRSPEPAELAAVHERWAPGPLDWRDPAALADAVGAAFAEIAGAAATPDAAPLLERARAAVAGLDWLDRERLATRIVSVLDPAGTGAGAAPPSPVTAQLRRILTALARESGVPLRRGLDPPTALHLLAALAVRDPELAARPGAVPEIERLLSGAAGTAGPAAGASPAAAAAPARPAWHRCEAAGVLLLTRALADTRLAALGARLGLPAPGLSGDPSAALLLSVGLAVAGSAGVREDGALDPALLALVGRDDALTAASLAAAWSSTGATQHRALRAELAALASGQRLGRLAGVGECRHAALPGFAAGTVARAAHLTLLAWSRWLPGLAESSPAFLLGHLLRRGGSVSVVADAVHVVLDPRPLDAVVELAGYLEPLERVPWLGRRALRLAREKS
jgi:hypothetical protein